MIFARSGRVAAPVAEPPRAARATAAPEDPEKRTAVVDYMADWGRPVREGDSVICLVGNFAALHNGTVITCDSAVRYSPSHFEFFGNVLINKGTTYAYGDRAEYDGESCEARLYSQLVKVLDGDATLYTYNLVFNTETNIGRFEGGGVLVNRENRLEADRGYYYVDTKELAGVHDVEMRNEEYSLRGDSVIYNLETDHAEFFERTHIWNSQGDYLYGDRGEYVKTDTLYSITRNGYILTEKQEVWCDSLDYFRAEERVVLRQDIQIDDSEYKTLAFGDYGEYWKFPGDVLLTRNPSVISYDMERGDSLFMRADSMFLYTIDRFREAAGDAAAEPPAELAGMRREPGAGLMPSDAPTTVPDRDSVGISHAVPGTGDASDTTRVERVADAPAEQADSMMRAERPDSVRQEPTPEERKALLREAAEKARAEKKAAAQAARKVRLEEIAKRRQEKRTQKLLEQKEREEKRLELRRERAERKLLARRLRAELRGKPLPADTSDIRRIDSLIGVNAAEQDSLAAVLGDSLAVGIGPADSLSAADTSAVAEAVDSIYRLIKGYRNVRTYRSDFQSVCDSMVAISTDSTIHLYIDPVLWNVENQVTSDIMDIYTANQQLERAEFVGSPIMGAQLDTGHYNQVSGKTMVAYFRDNKIFRNDVNGNARTIYYLEDDDTRELAYMTEIESGGISFYIEENQIVGITYRNSPSMVLYPMDLIPGDMALLLPGFKWQGERRPSQRDVFDRRMRPSEREERSLLPQPDFPIAGRIDRYRTELIERGEWADRNERLTPDVEEWMHGLGY